MRAPLQPVESNVVQSRNAQLKYAGNQNAYGETMNVDAGPAATQIELEAQAAAEEQHLKEWRRKWRKIMVTAVIYFDDTDAARQQAVQDMLHELGAQVQAFFHVNVTHVISDRQQGAVVERARDRQLKVYTYEKLVRFLSSLVGRPLEVMPLPDIARPPRAPGLTEMLQEDVVSRGRDDFHRFKGPYMLLWDPTKQHRVLLHREWGRIDATQGAGAGTWPQLRNTPAGTCPFANRMEDLPISSKRSRVNRSASLTVTGAPKRRALAVIHGMEEGHTAPQDKPLELSEGTENGTDMDDRAELAEENVPPATASQGLQGPIELSPSLFSLKQSPAQQQQLLQLQRHSREERRRFGEIAASGMQRYSGNSTTQSTTQSGEVAAPRAAASREVVNLQRKVFNARPFADASPSPSVSYAGTAGASTSTSVLTAVTATPALPSASMPMAGAAQDQPRRKHRKKSQERKPGFCENCLERYEDFAEHVQSRSHQRRAQDSQRFAVIDKIIASLQRVALEPFQPPESSNAT